jgi:cell division protein FtsW
MKKTFNFSLFFLTLFFIVFSFIFLACLSAPLSLQNTGDTYYYLLRQLRNFLPALVLGFIAYKIGLNFFKKYAFLIVFINIIFLFLVFIPGIGVKTFGASRWIDIFGFSFQPSELLKITAIIYLSAWVASRFSDTETSDWKIVTRKSYHNIVYVLAPFIAFLGLIALGLVLQRDLSTLGIIGLTLLVIYFSAKTPFWHSLIVIIGGGVLALVTIILEPYRFSRILTFLNSNTDPLGTSYQVKQAEIALGSGGIFGKGLGMSVEKFPGFLPTPMSDSIFAIIGEELGFIGALAIVVAFIMLFYLGLKISRESNDKFSKMIAIGIVFWITLQAFINISSTIGIFPLAGIPLPFFSYGGSHLLTEMVAIGLLLNISKNT